MAGAGYYDRQYRKIPDRYPFSIVLLWGIKLLVAGGTAYAGYGRGNMVFTMADAVLEGIRGMLAVSMPMLLTAIMYRGAFGGGDIKLTAAAGLIMGWKDILAAFILGIILSTGQALFLFVWRKEGRKARFPIGPFLCIGIAAVFCFGEKIRAWIAAG